MALHCNSKEKYSLQNKKDETLEYVTDIVAKCLELALS